MCLRTEQQSFSTKSTKSTEKHAHNETELRLQKFSAYTMCQAEERVQFHGHENFHWSSSNNCFYNAHHVTTSCLSIETPFPCSAVYIGIGTPFVAYNTYFLTSNIVVCPHWYCLLSCCHLMLLYIAYERSWLCRTMMFLQSQQQELTRVEFNGRIKKNQKKFPSSFSSLVAIGQLSF